MSTVIKIKYTENTPKTNETFDNSSLTLSETSSNDKELLVNINCNVGLVENYIRETIRLEQTDEIDLWEESTSQLKNISSLKPATSGLEVFQPNGTYFLIIIERNSSGHPINYVPLISGKPSRALSEILSKTKRQSKKKSSAITPLREKGVRKKLPEKSK